MKRQAETRGTQGYAGHNVPNRARSYPHIAAFFHAEGERAFPGNATGRELATELVRGLHPSARSALFEEAG